MATMFTVNAQTVTVTGASGTAGPYTTLKDAFDAINGSSQSGNTISIKISGTTTETASAVLNAGAWTSLSIAPIGGSASVLGSLAAPLIDLSGADNVILDGRIGGVGSSKDLIIGNSNTGGIAIRFIGDATSNIVRYCTISGSNNTATSGVVVFSTASSTGNDNNTITNCTLKDSTTTPVNIIYSLGSAGFENSDNTISNNEIANFFNSGIISSGVLLSSNSTSWTIIGNSFYQVTPRVFTGGVAFNAISILNTSGSGFVISDNVIGGRSADAGGFAWTQSGSSSIFVGIRLSVGTTVGAASVQNNTIKNISITTSSTSALIGGIVLEAGSANIGTVTGNVIGDMSATGNITFTSSAVGGAFAGIIFGGGAASQTVNVEKNQIGGIAVSGTGTPTLRGISCQGAAPEGRQMPVRSCRWGRWESAPLSVLRPIRCRNEK